MAHLVGCKSCRVCSSCNFLREKTLKSLTRLQSSAILGEPLLEEFPLTFSKMPRPGGTMSSSERRIAPREIFSIPVRIRPLIAESLSVAAGSTVSRNVTSSNSVAGVSVAVTQMSPAPAGSRPARVLDMQEGETVNLSERGIYFKTAQKVKIGQAMELYFTLPRELTGRSPEPVRCSARVVHVEQHADERGWTGVGASVEQFEPLQRFRTWDN
jgi:hypothetical protein